MSAERKEPPTCGTDAAYQRHRSRSKRPCLPCLRAHNAYTNDREYAVRWARSRLAAMFPAEYRALLDEELGKLEGQP